MALSLRDIVVKVAMALDPSSAKRMQTEMQDALDKGTDPSAAQQNVKKLETTVDSFGKVVQRVGTMFASYFGARAIVRFIEESISAFARFDQKLQQSVAIMSGVDVAMRVKLGDSARELSKTLNIEATHVAESYYFLASAGLNAKQSIAALPVVAYFAKAGLLDMARATEVLTQANASLGYKSADAAKNMAGMARIADVVVMASTRAQMTIGQFAEAIQNKAGAALRSFHKDVEEGAAALAVLANQGIKGAVAGERLDIFLRQATIASQKHAAAFKAYGITVFDTTGKMRNLADIVGDLTRAFKPLNDQQQVNALMQLGFQMRTINVVRQFLGQADAMREYEKALRSAAGYTKQVAEKELQTPMERWGQFKQKITDARIEIGEAFIPALLNMSETMGKEDDPNGIIGRLRLFAQYLSENPNIIQSVVMGLRLLVGTLGVLWDAFNIVADVIVLGVDVPLITLGAIVTASTFVIGGLVKGIGALAEATTNGALGKGIEELGDKILAFAKKAGSFTGERVDNFLTTGADFGKRMMNKQETALKPRNRAKVGDFSGAGSGREGDGVGDGEMPVTPDTEEVTRKKQELLNKLQEMMAKHTATATDDQLQKLKEIEQAYSHLYGKKIPEDVKRAFEFIRGSINQEAIATMQAKQFEEQFKDVYNEKDQKAREAEIDDLSKFIDWQSKVVPMLDKGSVAQEKANKTLEQAVKLRAELLALWFKTMMAEDQARAKEKQQELTKEMEKYRTVGLVAARDMENAFKSFFTVLFTGAKNGEGAFQALGKAIIGSLSGGIAQYASKKAQIAFAGAAEEIGYGIADLGNPLLAPLAPFHFSAAAQLAGAGALWAALGGAASAGASGLGASSGGSIGNQSETSRATVGSPGAGGNVTNIFIDGFDPNNPRHQALLAQGVSQYADRVGGILNIQSRNPG